MISSSAFCCHRGSGQWCINYHRLERCDWLQHHRSVCLRHPRHWSADSAADGRQHQEHHVLRAAVRGPRARPVPRHLPRPASRRTRARRTALLEAALPLPVTGDHDPLDKTTSREDGLVVADQLESVFLVTCCVSTLCTY